VNRLEDSFILWKSIVQNRLLAHVNIVLFLNKCDLLERKLAAGARVSQYMLSYGDRPNEYEAVSKCESRWNQKTRIGFADARLPPLTADFRNKFGALHQTYTPNKERGLFSAFL
jgi:hypothetical protein